MPTPDPTNVLFKIAHPNLYVRNPFNLLNLPIDATARDIRRRREDIEAAFEAGTEAEEFRHVLPLDASRKAPTPDAVHEAFDALNDPELRIAYSFFWFWPDPETGNRNYEKLFTDGDTYAEWSIKARKIPARQPLRTAITHNLGVFNHLKGLDYDIQLLEREDWRNMLQKPFAQEADEHWRAAIRYWNTVSTDAEAWHVLSDIVSSLNDPRLDYRFARSLRDQFAFAFDQINVELAIDFAKVGRDTDAKRQVEYMKLSQPEADDVEGTFDDAFAGLQRQTEAIVKAAREEVDRNPKSGLTKIDEILERTKEQVQISRIVFEKGTPIRESIITTIFAGVRNCMIAYGNETKNWYGCLTRIPALKTLAENDRQRTLVAEDEKIIAGNKKYQDEEETCWFCKQKFSTCRPRKTATINLWGDMRMGAQFGEVTFSKRSIGVPLCDGCAGHINMKDHPYVKEWLDKGWRVGSEPTQEDISNFYGKPRRPTWQEREASISSSATESKNEQIDWGCLFWIIAGVVVLIVLGLCS